MEKQVNFLDGITIYEIVPIRTLFALLVSGKLCDNWNRTNYAIERTKQLYANERKQIEDYIAKYDYTVGGIPVEYKRARHGWGRAYGNKSLCLSNMYRATRHTLARESFYDIDIKNCQVEILRQVAKANNLTYTKCLDDYCSNREEIIKQHLAYCGLGPEHRWLVKTLFLRLIFCGSWSGFYISCKKDHGLRIPEKPTQFCSDFKSCVEKLSESITKENPLIKRVAENNKDRKDSKTSVAATTLSLYLQDFEERIIAKVLNDISQKTPLMKKGDKLIGSYEYDGFKLSKELTDVFEYDGHGGKQAVCKLASDITKTEYDLDLIFEEKEMDEGHDISDVKDADIDKLMNIKSKTTKDLMDTDPVASFITGLTEKKLCEVVMEHTDKSFLFMMPEKRWMSWDGQKWKPDDVALWNQLPTIVNEYVREKYKQDWSDLAEVAMSNLLTELESYKKLHNVVKLAEKLFADYEVQFDMNTDLIGFNNGVWDITEKHFRSAVREDFVTMSCGYDFEFETNPIEEQFMTEVKSVLEHVHPIPEHREFFMMILASGLSGRAIEHFFVYNGAGRNGKGLINQAMRLLLGDYFCYGATCIVTESNKFKQSGGANPEKAKLNKKRYIVMKEPDAQTPIQNSTVKDITGGGTIQARACFSNSTDVELHGTFCMETNKRPPVAEEAQHADMDRWIDYLFSAHFTANEDKWDDDKYIYPIDPNLKKREWWIARRMAFMKILISYLNKLHDRNYILADIIPADIKQRTLEYLQGSYQIHRLFMSCFEVRKDDVDYSPNDRDFTIPQIATEVLNCKAFLGLTWKERQKLSVKEVKDYFMDNDFFSKDYYRRGNSTYLKGYRLIKDDDENEETDKETEPSKDDYLMSDDESVES
ncbi:MAG: hypothetical protein ACPHF2_03200 [Crocinitomicaceae bacterium]